MVPTGPLSPQRPNLIRIRRPTLQGHGTRSLIVGLRSMCATVTSQHQAWGHYEGKQRQLINRIPHWGRNTRGREGKVLRSYRCRQRRFDSHHRQSYSQLCSSMSQRCGPLRAVGFGSWGSLHVDTPTDSYHNTSSHHPSTRQYTFPDNSVERST